MIITPQHTKKEASKTKTVTCRAATDRHTHTDGQKC